MRSNCGEVLLARTAALAIGNAGRFTADLRERPSAVLLSRTPRLDQRTLLYQKCYTKHCCLVAWETATALVPLGGIVAANVPNWK
jgi:hypothetical protein